MTTTTTKMQQRIIVGQLAVLLIQGHDLSPFNVSERFNLPPKLAGVLLANARGAVRIITETQGEAQGATLTASTDVAGARVGLYLSGPADTVGNIDFLAHMSDALSAWLGGANVTFHIDYGEG